MTTIKKINTRHDALRFNNNLTISYSDSDRIEDLPYLLALWRVPRVGFAYLIKLLDAFPHLPDLFKAKHEQLAALGVGPEMCSYISTPDWAGVSQDLAWSAVTGNSIMTFLDEDYPPLLREISSAPPILFIRGNRALLPTPQLAIVGSRNPTANGAENAYQFAYTLAQAGLTITSGLALGIDAASHRGALDSRGKTIAVMGTGLDRIYPARNQELAERIVTEQGTLISEFPIGTPPTAQHFPRRNRIISGLSVGVLVVEAALSSGSLITAHNALDQGREVFAIPGSIHNPLARGCHTLLRAGAKLVEIAQDVCEELGVLTSACLSLSRANNKCNAAIKPYESSQYYIKSPAADIASASTQANIKKGAIVKDSALAPTDSHTGGTAQSSLSQHNIRNRDTLLPSASLKEVTSLDANYQQLLQSIDYATTPVDRLVEQSGLTASVVSSMLLHLELQGFISGVPGGYMRNKA